ncbi:MAG: hypothetical protein FJX51_06310 [Alphaproteobacteria bacterium]|nr:hypothetical protein [Alphaproteobacteria bacterium]
MVRARRFDDVASRRARCYSESTPVRRAASFADEPCSALFGNRARDITDSATHPDACACCGDILAARFGRRRFLHLTAGAAKIAYGADKSAKPDIEAATHKAALIEFRKQVKARHPKLEVEIGLMALSGEVEMFG